MLGVLEARGALEELAGTTGAASAGAEGAAEATAGGAAFSGSSTLRLTKMPCMGSHLKYWMPLARCVQLYTKPLASSKFSFALEAHTSNQLALDAYAVSHIELETLLLETRDGLVPQEGRTSLFFLFFGFFQFPLHADRIAIHWTSFPWRDIVHFLLGQLTVSLLQVVS